MNVKTSGPAGDAAVMVTGAATGIGWASAAALVDAGFHVFASVRRAEDAARLTARFGAAVTPLCFDVTDEAAVRAGAAEVARQLAGQTLRGLVNNAGVALSGPLMHQPLAAFRHQLEVNIVGTLAVTQAFLPLLGARADALGPPGRIVNVSSVAGRMTAPFLGAYAASKHGLEAMTDALRRELQLYGIDVLSVQPGPILTPIWDKAAAADIQPYLATDYAAAVSRFRAYALESGRGGLPAERVARTILRLLTMSRPPTRRVIVRSRLADWSIPRRLPDRLVDRIVGRIFGLAPRPPADRPPVARRAAD